MHETISKNIKLICPSCRKMTSEGLTVSNLELEDIIQKQDEYILYSFFKCENPKCNTKFPIIEGVPCIIKLDEQYWWSELAAFLTTLDPPEEIKRFISELQMEESNSSNSKIKQTGLPNYNDECLLGCSLDNNYGEFSPNYKPDYQWTDYRPYWKTVIEISKPKTEVGYGITLELGCSVGRYTFELARMSKLAVGLDFRFRPVLEAARFQRQRKIKFNRKVRGVLFQEVQTDFEPPDNTFFMVGNALDPPFLKERFDLVAGLNLLDSVKLPRILLGQMNALLHHGGTLILASSYEWSLDICEPTEWLESEMIDGPEMIRSILKGEKLPEYGLNYTVESEQEVIWPLKNHDRYWSIFRTDLIRAKKR